MKNITILYTFLIREYNNSKLTKPKGEIMMLETIKRTLKANADSTGVKFNIGDSDSSKQANTFTNTYMESSMYLQLCEILNQEQREQFFRELKYDFVCVSKKEHLNFVHLTNYEKQETIENDGLHAAIDWIPNLGIGIYVWDSNDQNSEVSMLQFKHHNKLENTSEIHGTFHGEYHKCIFDNSGYVSGNHEGYVVLKTLHVPAEDILKKALI